MKAAGKKRSRGRMNAGRWTASLAALFIGSTCGLVLLAEPSGAQVVHGPGSSFFTPSETGPVCQTDGSWRLDYSLSVGWQVNGVDPAHQPTPEAVQITDFELTGVIAGNFTSLWSPNPMPPAEAQGALATVIFPVGAAGKVDATITFKPTSEPAQSLGPVETVLDSTCIPHSGTTTTSPSTTTTSTSTTTTSSSTTTTLPVVTTTIHMASTSLTVGGSTTVTASGFAPGEAVTAVLQSAPLTIGTFVASAGGGVNFTLTIPSAFATGTHILTLTGQTSGRSASQQLTVTAAAPATTTTAPKLAFTGSPSHFGRLLTMAVALISMGVFLSAVNRRKRTIKRTR